MRFPILVLASLTCLPLVAAVAQKREPESYSVWVRRDAVPVRRLLAAPVEQVWEVLPQAFRALGYSGGRSAREGEMIVLTPSLTIKGRLYEGELNSDYIECGRTAAGQFAADVYEVRFAVLARLQPEGDSSTSVEVVIDGTARDRTQSSNAVFCTGTGKIEAALLQILEERLSKRSDDSH